MPKLFGSDYRDIGPEGNALLTDIHDAAQKLHDLIGRAESVGTAVEEIQAAKKKIVEAVMWAERGINR